MRRHTGFEGTRKMHRKNLLVHPTNRLSTKQILDHPWLEPSGDFSISDCGDLLNLEPLDIQSLLEPDDSASY